MNCETFHYDNARGGWLKRSASASALPLVIRPWGKYGSVANSKGRTWSAIRFRPVLHSDAEKSMDELTLAHRITLCQPADLSFPNRMHALLPFDGSPVSSRPPE